MCCTASLCACCSGSCTEGLPHVPHHSTLEAFGSLLSITAGVDCGTRYKSSAAGQQGGARRPGAGRRRRPPPPPRPAARHPTAPAARRRPPTAAARRPAACARTARRRWPCASRRRPRTGAGARIAPAPPGSAEQPLNIGVLTGQFAVDAAVGLQSSKSSLPSLAHS